MEMETPFFMVVLILFPIVYLLLIKKRSGSNRTLPPGSLGIPIIGQSLELRRAMLDNTADKWVRDRVRKYGPVSKLSLFRNRAVLIHGPAANKFLFTSDSSTIAYQQTKSVRMILGERNLFELSVEDHKRVRDALLSFLKPDSLKHYVEKIDAQVRDHLQTHWIGKQRITGGSQRDELAEGFQEMVEGTWTIPIRLPFTRFSRGLRASERVHRILKNLVDERRAELIIGSKHRDLITCLLRSGIEEEEEGGVITDKEIVHNTSLVMVAGHDTSSVLITFILRLLSKDHAVYSTLLQEQKEIAKKKAPGESLTWEDLSKMKYTWRVAMETLRMIPPIFGGFRKAQRDIEYGGYLIPKDWPIFWVPSMTQMDESIFQDPSKFDPDRFENQIPPYSFVAFGGGPRICPGNELARIETLVAIHYLVTRFTWKLLSDDSFIRDPMPAPSQGLELEITNKRPL